MNENHESQTGAVVVGVDGSAGAGAALRWALAEARLRKTRLRVVHAWTVSFSGLPAGGYGYLGGPLDSAPDHTPSEMHAAAEALLGRVTADAGAQGVEIECQVVEGGPAASSVLITRLARLSSCMPDFLSLPPRSEAMRKQTFVVTELALERQARHAER